MMANEINDVVTQFVHEHMYMHIVLIALSVAVMLLSMAVDFFTGLQKARRNGVARTSQGLKKTAAKATKYFTPYMVLVGIDLIAAWCCRCRRSRWCGPRTACTASSRA